MKRKAYKIIFMFLIFMTMIFVIKEIRITPFRFNISTNGIIMLKNQWSVVYHQDQNHSYCEYMYMIPENAGAHLMLSIESYWASMDIYLDNQKIYSYNDENQNKGVARQWVELADHAAGKKLSIRSSSYEKNLLQSLNGHTYLGDKGAVYVQFFNDNLYALIFAIFSIMLSGIVFLSANSFHTQLNYNNKGMKNLALFILTTAICIVSDSQFLQYYIESTSLISLISFLSFILFPIFLIGFIKDLVHDQKKIWNILRISYVILFVVFLIVYLFHLIPLYQLIIIQHILLIVTILAIVKNCIFEIKKYQNKDLKEIMIGFGILSFFGLVALIVFYQSVDEQYSYIFSIGIIGFVLFLVDVAYKKLVYYLKESARTIVYKELAYKDALTQLESRTAFMEEHEKVNKGDLTYIVFDINNLKIVNDQYGHQQGDELLIAASKCIQDNYQYRGKCYRIGGDEFVVILKDHTKDDIELSLQEFEAKLKEVNQTRKIKIEIAYGYATQENEKISKEELFKKADKIMYQNKEKMKKSQRKGE